MEAERCKNQYDELNSDYLLRGDMIERLKKYANLYLSKLSGHEYHSEKSKLSDILDGVDSVKRENENDLESEGEIID